MALLTSGNMTQVENFHETKVIATLSELSPIYFNHAVSHLLDRFKICTAICSYVEDLVEVESTIGKSLTKIGTQNFVTQKPELFSAFTATWEEIYRITTGLAGRHHINTSLTISQNICKTFPDHVKSMKKNVKTTSNKLGTMVEELKKIKQKHVKNCEKYMKMISDSENAIKSRDAASDFELNEKDIQPKDDSFVNRSISKMLLTKKPDEKKLTEKCREYINELDSFEVKMISLYQRLQIYIEEVNRESVISMIELNNEEKVRFGILQDGLSKLFVTNHLMVDRMETSFNNLSFVIGSINIEQEFQNVETLFEDHSAVIIPPIEIAPHSLHSDKIDMPIPLLKITREVEVAAELLEALRTLSARIVHFLAEAAESNRTYVKNAQKCLEKNGYSKFSSPHGSHLRSGNLSPSNLSLVADVISTLESPSMRMAWESAVRGFGGFSDSHLKTSEMILDNICTPLDVMTKKLEVSRKETFDKLSMHMKRIETSHANVARSSQKLLKHQLHLHERQTTLKKAKDDLDAKNAPVTTDGTSNSKGDSISSSNNSSQQLPLPPPNTTSPTTFELQSPSGAERNRKGSIAMMAGMSGLMPSTSKISQVARGETPGERIIRIEGSIFNLEDEESSLVESSNAALATLQGVYNIAKDDLIVLIKLIKEIVNDHLQHLKSKMVEITLLHQEIITQCRAALSDVKVCFDFIDPHRDMIYLVKSVLAAGNNKEEPESVNLLELTSIEPFEPYRNEVVEEERRIQGMSRPTHKSLGSLEEADAMNFFDALTPSDCGENDSKKSEEDALLASSGKSLDSLQGLASPMPTAGKLESNTEPEETELPNPIQLQQDKLDGDNTDSNSNNTSETNLEITIAPVTTEEIDSLRGNDDVLSTPMTKTNRNRSNSFGTNKTSLATTAGTAKVLARAMPSRRARGNGNGAVPSETPDNIQNMPMSMTQPFLSQSQTVIYVKEKEKTQQQQQTAPNSISKESLNTTPKDKDEYELSKFGLQLPRDKVLESYSCALYPKKGLLSQGRMYITQHFIAFNGWPETRLLLALENVTSIEKTNTLYYVPNAILVTTSDKEEYFFGSFIDRDQCHNILTSLAKVAKRLVELHGHHITASNKDLIFGYQFPRALPSPAPTQQGFAVLTSSGALSPTTPVENSFATIVSDESNANVNVNPSKEIMDARVSSPVNKAAGNSVELTDLSIVPIKPVPVPFPLLVAPTTVTTITGSEESSKKNNVPSSISTVPTISADVNIQQQPQNVESSITAPSDSRLALASASASTPTISASVSASNISESSVTKVLDQSAINIMQTSSQGQTQAQVVVESVPADDKNDGVNLSTLFASSGIAELGNFTLENALVADLWRCCWLHGQGYRYSTFMLTVHPCLQYSPLTYLQYSTCLLYST